MEFLELIRMGLFEAFWYFSNPWFNSFAYISVVIGFVIQMISFHKAKTKIRKFIPPIVFFVGCLVCECIAPAFVWMELFAVDIIYCLFVYLFIGAVFALIISLIKSRKTA